MKPPVQPPFPHDVRAGKGLTSVPLLATLALLSLFITPAHAWKPVTHAYLAQLAIDEALNNNGKITIYAVDYSNGKILHDAQGNKRVVGTYQCDPTVLNAIRQNRRQYMAGVCGPDAYPDIATGQLLIHPAGDSGYGGQVNDKDVNAKGPGPDPWLRFLYNQAFKGSKYSTDANKAFVMGFLAHAAGDMYAHTYINNYSGGEFNFHYTQNGVEHLSGNALRHFIMEGYIAERTPEFNNLDDYNVSLDNGVGDFVYNTMVKGDKQGILQSQNLLAGADRYKSLPFLMSALRQTLDDRINAYYKLNKAEQVAYSATHPLWITYQEGWRKDIDEGLVAFPEFSRRVSQLMFFYPRNQSFDSATLEQTVNAYYSDHLRYMLGEPHWVAAANDLVAKITSEVLDTLGITFIKETIQSIKDKAKDALCNAAFGMSYDDCKRYLTDPTTNFDSILNTKTANTDNGVLLNRAGLDSQLHLVTGGKYGYFDVEQFPAAYNTVTMIKLTLLPQSELQHLLKDLNGGVSPSVPQDQSIADNVLLGYNKSLDAANQWKTNAPRMLLARNAVLYRSIFMAFPGETPYPNVSNVTVISNQASGNPTFTATFTLASDSPFGNEVGTDAVLVGNNAAVPLDASFSALPSGQRTGTFHGQLPGVTQPTTLQVIVSAGNTVVGTITVNPAKFVGMFVNTTGGYSGGGGQYTYSQPKDVSVALGLDANAPPGGAVVTLTSAQPSLLTVPNSVTIPEGGASAAFTPIFASTAPVGTQVAITATYAGVSKTVTFQKGTNASVTVMTQLLPEQYTNSLQMRPSVAQRNLREIGRVQQNLINATKALKGTRP